MSVSFLNRSNGEIPVLKSYFALALLLLSAASNAEETPFAQGYLLTGLVNEVHDGDTAVVVESSSNREVSIRFWGADTPESQYEEEWPTQPYSAEAAEFTRALIEGKEVMVRMTGEVTYNRHVGEIIVGGRSVSRELVRAGLAHWYAQFASYDTDLEKLEALARDERRGLWADPNVVEPWEWRRMDHNCDEQDDC